MALDYTGKVAVRGKQIAELALEQLYQDKSIAKGYIAVNTGAKHGVTKTETSTTANEQAYTGAALTGDGDFTLFDYQINHVKSETKIDILQDTLRDTPFADDMSAGAANIDSNRFMQLAADQLGKRVAYNASVQRWRGATAATKAAIAALTPGAGQGSITAAMQTKIAALPTTLRDGWLVSAVYNNWNATKTAGLGKYIKVTGTTLTSTNVAGEFAKIYALIPPVERDDTLNPYILHAPLSVKSLIMIANNAVGAAQQINFAVTGVGADQEVSYNGITINFCELPDNVILGAPTGSLEYNTDLESDDNMLEVGEYANGSDVKYFRNIQAWSVHVSKQDKVVLYGG
jgi:hypothetical protein